jgi:hypothetical protein
MARGGGDGSVGTAELERSMIEAQLEKLEGSVAPRPPGWAWSLIVLGLVAVVGLGIHAYTAYTIIAQVNTISHLDTGNPLMLFQDLATNGPRVTAAIDANSRNAYSRALTQYVLDGTGVCLGVALAFTGLFIRLNR